MKISSSASLLSVLPFLVAACAADTGDSAEPTGAAAQAVTANVSNCCNCLKSGNGWNNLGTNGAPGINGGFELGNMNGWSIQWPHTVTSPVHSGRYAAMLFWAHATDNASQTFVTASWATRLSFWYIANCGTPGGWAGATLRDNVTNVTTTVLPHTCSPTFSWQQVTVPVIPGRSYTFTFSSNDVGGDTNAFLDDVALYGACSIPGCSSIVTPGNYCPTSGGGVCTYKSSSTTTATFTCSSSTGG